MGSITPQLPVIYLSDQTLKPGNSNWVEVRRDVRNALEDYGCFEVAYDRVSMDLKKSVIEAMDEIFDLPTEAKQRNVSPKPYTGYSSHNGLSESLAIQDADVLEKVCDFTQLLRPDHEANKSISETIHKFSEKLAELDVMVRRMVMESFGIEKYFDEHLNSTNFRLRLMKYVAPPDVVADDAHDDGADHTPVDAGDSASVNVNADIGVGANNNVIDDDDVTGDFASLKLSDAEVGSDVKASVDADDVTVNAKVGVEVDDVEETKLGLPSHTDKNLITVLYQHEIEGLEVKTKDEKWIRLKPSHNSFVVMAGDSLYALLNGRISRPFHRVRVTEKKRTRYSIAIFSTPNEDYIIEPPKELVDDKNPRIFKPFTFVDLMSFYHTEAGRRPQSTLHAYCAISPA